MKYFPLVATLASLLGSLYANPRHNHRDTAKSVQKTVTVYVTLTSNPNSAPTYSCPENPFNGQRVPSAVIATVPVTVKYPIPDATTNATVFIPTITADVAPSTLTTTTTTTTAAAVAPSPTLSPVANPYNDPNYVQKVNTILMNFINSPFTNTEISALSSLGSFIQYNYTMIVNTIPLSQPFTTDELSTIDSFASTLIPSSGKSSFVTLANSFIEFFSSNDDITSKVVANGIAIGKMYPNIINSASSLFTTMINYVKQKGIMEKLKLYGFYKQYKSQYSGYYSKASALVDKFSSVFPSLKNTPSLI